MEKPKLLTYDPTTELVTLPTGEQITLTEWAGKEDEKQPEPTEQERLRDFFFPRPERPRPGMQQEWKDQGRCPVCGELGRIHMSTMVCSVHGPY